MIDIEFLQKVEKIIYKIAETIEDADPNGEIDIDLNDGILTLITNHGTFIINKQSVAKEIWLSSPISGPYHFAFKDEMWLSRDNVELFDILTKELQIKISQ